MKHILLFAGLVAISTVGAQAHIGWDLATCTQKYGQEVKPLTRGNAGEVHYFTVGDMGLTVTLRNDKVKKIVYRKMSGQTFSSEEIDILQKKNQADILGWEGIEWLQTLSNPESGTQIWLLNRQGVTGFQSFITNQATSPDRPAYVFVIRTWDQISVDREAAMQDKLDKMRNL
ncbi:MAG: hypothetical protein JO279_11420 [Verrucomicrobia bacterium]|nr:hypothetical protein [Verrucomicrobiota bacterium]